MVPNIRPPRNRPMAGSAYLPLLMAFVAFFLVAPTSAMSFLVPPEIGTRPQKMSAMSDPVRDLRAAAASEPPPTETRLLNADFVPRAGWRGTVFPAVLSPVLCAGAVSAAALWLHESTGFMGIDATAHQLAGGLVSFLAVFRTQQAHARYWEGRGHLGVLMAGLVDVASMGSIHFSAEQPESAAAARHELARLLRLYFRETVRFLRRTSLSTARVSNYWLPADAPAPIDDALDCCVEARNRLSAYSN
jgi:hypothetical protein